MMMHTGLRNIVFGFVHFVEFDTYRTKIGVLFALELVIMMFGLRVLAGGRVVNGKK